MSVSRFQLVRSLVAVAMVAGSTLYAIAQPPPTVRIRGTIEAVDGPVLSIKSREGTDMKVRVTDNVAVFGVARTELSEIKQGSYIGVTAMPEPDGSQKAVVDRMQTREELYQYLGYHEFEKKLDALFQKSK